ncbi:M15 family metallopeptidase [Parelusimicrobium proximum]|uniref:M15 family metallopeptidase n=1 Tax=Parelusimicrobium proximum TaxID=3228953 RepID=UPI003D17B511
MNRKLLFIIFAGLVLSGCGVKHIAPPPVPAAYTSSIPPAVFDLDRLKVFRAGLAGLDLDEGEAQRFIELAAALEAKRDMITLVDKSSALAKDFVPSDMVPLSNYKNIRLSKKGMQLRREAAEAMSKMQAEASKEKKTILISSAYRSYSYQDGLYKRSLKRRGEEHTKKYVAVPGHSQHQLGTAVDFGAVNKSFEKDPAKKWLDKHASKFGFSLSYPEGAEEITGYAYEPWHYRYITPEAAALQDEFFEGSQQKMLEFLQKYFR